jgi:hypothetical protein
LEWNSPVGRFCANRLPPPRQLPLPGRHPSVFLAIAGLRAPAAVDHDSIFGHDTARLFAGSQRMIRILEELAAFQPAL